MNYKLSRFITEQLKKQRLTRFELVQAMGYHNHAKALRKFDHLLDTGECDPVFFRRLVAAIKPDPVAMRNALADTMREIRESHEREHMRKGERFVPFLFAVTQKRTPSPVFLGAIMAQRKKVPLPENFDTLCTIDKLCTIGSTIDEHLRAQNAHIAGFGRILGYLLCEHQDQPVHAMRFFDTRGRETDVTIEQKMQLGDSGTLSAGGKDIFGTLKRLLEDDSLWG